MTTLASTVCTSTSDTTGADEKMRRTKCLVSESRLMVGPNSWKLAEIHDIVLTGFCIHTQQACQA